MLRNFEGHNLGLSGTNTTPAWLCFRCHPFYTKSDFAGCSLPWNDVQNVRRWLPMFSWSLHTPQSFKDLTIWEGISFIRKHPYLWWTKKTQMWADKYLIPKGVPGVWWWSPWLNRQASTKTNVEREPLASREIFARWGRVPQSVVV